MKTIKGQNFELVAYELNDLEEKYKDQVISDECTFLIEMAESEEEANNITEEEVIETIEINNYLFSKTGKLLPTMYYTEKNKIVKTTFNLYDNEIEVSIS